MSACEPPSSGDPNHLFNHEDDEDPSEPEFFPDAGDDDHIQPDPLLKSGTFIVEPTAPTLATENQTPPPKQRTAQNGGAADRVSDREPEQFTSPRPSKTAAAEATTATTTPASSGRKGQKTPAGTSGAAMPPPERPSWLPEGWKFESKVRTSGATAGSYDRYYISESGQRFRSKVEVDYFLQTGIKPNKKAKLDADANHQEKSGSKKKKAPPLNFDNNNVPGAVRWVLTDAEKDQWTPFVGDKIVPKSTRQEWNAAFKFHF